MKGFAVKISVVTPVFNEREALPHLFRVLPEVLQQLAEEYEIVVVNDGSTDGTGEYLRLCALEDARIKVISFTRNFGQQAAMTAGLDCVDGDVVVVMDCDLQDPPEMLAKMLAKLHEGFDVVSCQRETRAGESLFKRWSATAFYQLMQKCIDPRIPAEVGDFRMYTRRAADALCGLREQHRFMRGIVAWMGMKEAILTFHRPARVAGETKYPVSKLIRLAWTAISSSSAIPLKVTSYVGATMLCLGVFGMGLGLVGALVGAGITNTALWIGFLMLLSGLQLCGMGLLGDYIGRIFEESKQRPLYVVGEVCNLECVPAVDRAIWLDTGLPYASSSGVRGEKFQREIPRIYGPTVIPIPSRDAG